MGLIQCAEHCKFQIDGYCNLEKCSTVNSLNKNCPYFIPLSFDYTNSLSQTANTYKLK